MLVHLRRALACAVFLCSAAAAQTFQCNTSLESDRETRQLRARAQADLVADFVLRCEGNAPSNGISGTVTVTLNTPLTSMITNPANNASEALLLINDPPPDQLNGQPIGATVSSPNVLQGVQLGANSVQFFNVPIMPAGLQGFQSQTFRFVNLRANASLLNSGANVIASVAVSASVPVAVPSPQQIVARVGPPLNVVLRTADDVAPYSMQLDACSGNNTTVAPQTVRDFLVKFTESFSSEFRARNTSVSLSNPFAASDQTSIESGTESGFVYRSFPAVSGMNTAGQASAGTRLVARFSGVPAGVQLWVSTREVLQGTSGTGIAGALIAVDPSGQGAFAPIPATVGPYARIDAVNGTAQAVWEIFGANRVALENIAFGVVVSVPAAPTLTGSIAVNGFHGPVISTTSQVRPYFAAETGAGLPAVAIRPCVTQLTISTRCPLNPGSVGLPFTQSLLSAGGALPHTWSIISGALPPGLTLAVSGLISGTPSQPGTFNFALRLTDGAGLSVSRECSMEVRASLSITTVCPLPDASQGQSYSATLAAAGGVAPYTWLIARGALPAGLTLLPGGQIVGQPSIPGSSSFTLRTTDQRSLFTEKECGLRVLAPFRLSPSALSFRAPSGGEPVAPQLIHMAAEPSGQVWDVRVSTFSGGNWLRTTPTNGRVPAVIEVTADTLGLGEGVYEGSLTVLTRGATQQSFGVGVRLEVTAIRPPALTSEPAGFLIAVPQGRSRSDRIVTLANRGSGTVPYATTLAVLNGQGWIEAPALAGALGPGATQTLALRINSGPLEPGLYRAVVRVRHERGSVEETLEVPVTLAVGNSRDEMQVEPQSVNLESAAGSVPKPVRLTVAASGEGAVNWEAGVRYPEGSPAWLTLSSASGRATTGAPSVVEARPAVDTLPPGRYRAEVAFTAAGVPNSPRTVLVSLNLGQPGSVAAPVIETLAIPVAARSDGGVPRGTIVIRNPTRGPFDVDFRLSTDSSFWNVTAPSGRTVAAGGQLQLDVAVDSARAPTAASKSTLFVQTSLDSRVYPVELVWLPGTSSRTASSQEQRPLEISCPSGGIVLASSSVPYGFRATAGSGLGVTVLAFERNGARLETGAISAAIGGSVAALRAESPGVWSGTVPVPESLDGAAVLSIYAEDRARSINGCMALPGTVTATGGPVIPSGAILSTASFARYQPLAPGGIVALFGSRLASGRSSGTLPLPAELNGTSVRAGGATVPLFFAADLGEFTQLNGVLPYGLAPNVAHQVVVNSPAGAALSEVVVAAAQPAIFTADQSGRGQAIAVHGTNPLLLAEAPNPIGPGEVLVIYCEGLGAVDPASPAGQAAGTEPLSRVVAPVSVTIGGVNAPVAFAGLTPGLTGLYQINLTVPQGVPAGAAVPVVVTAGGQSSTPATIAVRP
jgi:uncharacterized protein (TIGR03437 family)